jgi:hypothetical protein
VIRVVAQIAPDPGSLEVDVTGANVPAWIRVIGGTGIFLSVMPYIGVSSLPSDIQPLSLIVACAGVGLLVLSVPSRIRHVPWLVVPLCVMALLATISLVFRIVAQDIEYMWLVRSYYGYIAAPVIFTFFVHYLRMLESKDIARALDVALGVVFAGYILNALGLTWIIQAVVNRAIFVGFDHGRGFTSFFAEQSFISIQMAFLLFCYLLVGRLTKPRLVAVVIAASLSAAGQMFVTLGEVLLAYVLMIGVVALVGRGIRVRWLTRLGLAAIVIALFLMYQDVVAQVANRAGLPTRGITVVSKLIETGPAYIGQDTGVFYRIAGVLQAGATLVENPLNFRLAAASDLDFRETIQPTYAWLSLALFDDSTPVYSRRVSSSLGTWIIEFGVVGLLAAVSFIVMLIRRGVRADRTRSQPVLWAILFFVQVLFLAVPLANPSLWLLAGLIWVTATPQSAQVRRPVEELIRRGR